MKITVHIDDEIYEMEISKQPHEIVPMLVKINGEDIPIRIMPDWEHQFPKSIIVNNIAYEAEFEYGEDGFPKRMWLNGSPMELLVEFIGKEKLSKARKQTFLTATPKNLIHSPMPGKIVKILVRENQMVYEGNLCIILEAMKMENELESPQTGIVNRIYIKEGDLVEMDQVLISFIEQDEMFF